MTFRQLFIVVVLVLSAPAAWADGLGWRVSDDAGRTMYVVGTVHAAAPSFYPLPDAIESAFDQSKVLVLEVDVKRASARDIQAVIRERAYLPEGTSLKEQVSPEAWTILVDWSNKLGLSQLDFLGMNPWYAAIRMLQAQIVNIGLDPNLGVEAHFVSRAARRKIPVVELETVPEQLLMLANLSAPTQIAFLEQSLSGTEDVAAAVNEIMSAWRKGDAAGLATILSESYEGHTELYEVMIRQRNQRWLPVVEGMLASGRTHFVAVGALHVVGKDGLVELLEARGYKVEKL